MEYNSDTTQSEGIQSCDRCERLDWLDENMLCSFCVAWDEDVNEVEARLAEARAHVEALMEKCWQVDDFGMECVHCGATCDKGNTKHHVGCPYAAAREWLEAQDENCS